MKPTYLYVKQHNKTGLKYFGKTTKKDPLKYKGSGLHWKRHLKIHGNDVKTLWVQLFENEQELIEYAKKFSEENNIVNSDKWANLKNENGLDGGRESGFIGHKPSEEIRKNYSERMKKNNPMFDENVKQKHLLSMKSSETIKKKSQSKRGNTNVRGKVWYNNGQISKMFNSPPDDTWSKGRLNPHWNINRNKNEKKR